MPTNPYIDPYYSVEDQALADSLVTESIRFNGIDCPYIIRDIGAKDEIYGEDALSSYTRSYAQEFYINSFDSYQGDGAFLSKFNLEVRDTLKLTVSRSSFMEQIGSIENISRPRESDLIYFPLDKRLYIIKYVNKAAVFYQFGDTQFYELSCEPFEYSSEVFDTGIPEIDNIYKTYSYDIANFSILTQDNYMLTDQSGNLLIQNQQVGGTPSDALDDSDEIQIEAEGILDWSEIDPFSEGSI